MKPSFYANLTFYSIENGGPRTALELGWIRVPLVVKGAPHFFDVHIEFENDVNIHAGMSVRGAVYMLAPENITFFPKGGNFSIWNLRVIGEGVVV